MSAFSVVGFARIPVPQTSFRTFGKVHYVLIPLSIITLSREGISEFRLKPVKIKRVSYWPGLSGVGRLFLSLPLNKLQYGNFSASRATVSLASHYSNGSSSGRYDLYETCVGPSVQ